MGQAGISVVLKLSSVKLFHCLDPHKSRNGAKNPRVVASGCRSPGRRQYLQQDESSVSEHCGVHGEGLCIGDGDDSTLLLL